MLLKLIISNNYSELQNEMWKRSFLFFALFWNGRLEWRHRKNGKRRFHGLDRHSFLPPPSHFRKITHSKITSHTYIVACAALFSSVMRIESESQDSQFRWLLLSVSINGTSFISLRLLVIFCSRDYTKRKLCQLAHVPITMRGNQNIWLT